MRNSLFAQEREKMKTLQVLLLSSCALVVLSEYRRTARYYNQKVVKCGLTENFRQRLHTLLERDFVDPWGLDEKGRLHVRLGDELWSELEPELPECFVAIESVEEYVRMGEKQMHNASVGAGWFEEYHQYKDILGWYQSLASNNSNIVKYVDSIGKSIEGRDIPAVHFTAESNPSFTVYLQCQIHAREWISGAVCMYVANYLCENYGKDTQVTDLLNSLQFVFVPVVNPDGYEYTWSNDRLWRKNRKVNSGSSCVGVDLNRNYNDHWGDEEGSSSNPCSDTYHGVSAASEPETQATQAYFAQQNSVVAAIDWHSFSQLILRPYGWTDSPCPDEQRLKELGDDMAKDILDVHGYTYTSQTIADLYIASGGASDWFYSDDATRTNDGYRAAGYTIELRDTGRYGFQLPPDQIIPNGQEVIPAVLNLAGAMLADPIVSR